MTFAIERQRPALVPLPGAHRVAVVAFVGSAGTFVAHALRARLAHDAVFSVEDRDPAKLAANNDSLEDDATVARIAKSAGLDAIIEGTISAFEINPTVSSPTLLTKSTLEGPKDVPTVRRAKTARIAASFRVILASGRVERGRAIEKDLHLERLEDPMPRFITLEPKTPPLDEIPGDDEVAARLADTLVAEISRDVTPRREPAIVTWEDAGGLDDGARRSFARREYARAATELRELVDRPTVERGQPRNLSPYERASLVYNLGLCEDLQGDLQKAETHLDEALTLSNNELHQTALRDLRRRIEDERKEERR